MDRILAAVLGIPLGFVIMIYRFYIKQFTGNIDWAEQYLGAGVTYNLYIIIGPVIAIVSLMYAVRTLQDLFNGALCPIFGVGQH